MSTVRISGVKKHSSVNGPGVRYVLFFQGCPHNCPGCQNPETHDPMGGTEQDTADVIREILQTKYLDGLTFSGGDPALHRLDLRTDPKGCGRGNRKRSADPVRRSGRRSLRGKTEDRPRHLAGQRQPAAHRRAAVAERKQGNRITGIKSKSGVTQKNEKAPEIIRHFPADDKFNVRREAAS